ncbi:interleukin-17 receptor A [Emys orbicularis]|uniref:interleukin-17 receptor A n=1 Tax=Emys orbicularis TaxID=82168 RepID=UPI0031FCB4E9
MDQSWLQVLKWTPSAPSVLDVHPDVFHEEGKLLPVLRIEWMVATDASIQYLQGVELAVLQLNNNQQICAQFDFQNNLPLQVRPDGGRWNFTFNRFEVEPGQMYQVTVHHLPKLGTSGDHNCKSTSYTVPDCKDPAMKRTMPCMKTGSLWEPSIHGKSLDDNSLLVSFNPGMESARYRIHVTSFPDDEKQCKETTHDIYEPLQSGQQHRVNVTVKIKENLKACCRYKVQIQPFFTMCGTDCLRHSAVIPCPSVAPPTYPVDDPIMWLYWCITGICILLVGSVIAGAIYMTRRQVGRQHRKYSSHELLPPQLTPPSLRPRKVWIVYSADHPLYVDVVLKFAQFLITVCGTEVVLDLLEKRPISEIGALPWLTRQKKEMEELSSKIIILCSRGTRAKWQAMLGKEGTAVSLKQDQWQPTGDMFTPALNLILPDFKKPACFGMYIVCYFEGISEDKDIPDPFNVTSKYQLMDRFEDIYFLIQDMEKFEPGRIHQIQEITAENYAENSNGWKLKEAVQTFQEWQAKYPDWFERENTCSEDESLDKEILEEFMPGNGEVIIKQQLHVQEPDPNGCCAVSLHVNEDEGGNFKLQLQLNPQGNPTSQTLMIPMDEAPPVQMVEPISITGGKNATSHQVLTNTDWMEGIPLLETSVPMRNSIILHDDFDVPSSDNQRSADHLPNEMRQQLEGLMYSLYQQSVISSEPSLRQEDAEEQQQQMAFNNPCKDQRQSVQSDQGYISRCSPLPPDDLVEEEEEEDQEQENKMPSQCLSPEVLDSLKSLQQKLLFQEIQQKSVWEHMGGMMDTGHCAADS